MSVALRSVAPDVAGVKYRSVCSMRIASCRVWSYDRCWDGSLRRSHNSVSFLSTHDVQTTQCDDMIAVIIIITLWSCVLLVRLVHRTRWVEGRLTGLVVYTACSSVQQSLVNVAPAALLTANRLARRELEPWSMAICGRWSHLKAIAVGSNVTKGTLQWRNHMTSCVILFRRHWWWRVVGACFYCVPITFMVRWFDWQLAVAEWHCWSLQASRHQSFIKQLPYFMLHRTAAAAYEWLLA